MANLSQTDMPDAIISAGQANSQTMDWAKDFFDSEAISIEAPAALDVLTFTIQVSQDGTNWGDLQDSAGTAIGVPSAANAARTYNGIITAMKFWRIHGSGNVAADRNFKISKVWRGF